MKYLIASTPKRVAHHVRERFFRLVDRAINQPRGAYPVAIQGIQRSGTNFLTVLLEGEDYRVLNRIDPKRDNPRHKHFRWQHDKTTIVMDRRYANTTSANSVNDVNEICAYPSETKHIVVFRSPEKWLNSIYRWGIDNSWFESEDAFFSGGLHENYLREWDAFYGFWQNRAHEHPKQVLMVSYDALVKDTAAGLKRVDAFMDVIRPSGLSSAGPITKVRHSRPITEKRQALHRPELDELLSRKTEFDWKFFEGATL